MSITHDQTQRSERGRDRRVVSRAEVLGALELAHREQRGAGVVHLDIDRFHHVNTQYGHDIGDLVLEEISERVLVAAGAEVMVAGVDGDGFLVARLDVELGTIRELAERLLAAIRQPVLVGDVVVEVRASAGLACRTTGDQRVDLVERAFLACRRAKATAPGTIVGYEGALGTEADRLHRVEDGLRRAIAEREFRLFVQPKVNLTNGNIIGVEALVRWQHPTDGLLPPAAFLPSAEAAGLMVSIGDWVLDEAIDLAARWRSRRAGAPIRMWVNLAAQQLAAGDHLRQRVRAAIADGRISPQSIGFEVTESSLLEDLPSAVGVLSSLRELGVEIALDDFGTGYSSLSYLRQLPVTAVKIDQRFVAGIGGSLADEVIVEAVIDLAHALGLRVVAEGVEHVGQADALVRMGADVAQGYHFAVPMPPDELEPLLGLPWCGAEAPIARTVAVDQRADHLPGLGSPRARLLLAALDTAHDSVLVTTAGGDGQRPPIVYVNEAFQVETGYRPGDVIGRTVDMLLPQPPDLADLAWLDHVPSTAGAATRELGSRRADGSTYLCELTVSPISDERGVHTHWLHVRRDLTLRRAAEGARARFEGLIEQTPSLVLLAETGGQWVYANAAQRRAIGLPLEAPVDAMNIFDVFPSEVDRIENEVLPALQATGIWSGEAEFVDPATGALTEVYTDVQVMDDPLRPGMQFFAAISRDVSEVKALARAEHRRRELGSFAADVAHGAMHSGSEFLGDLDRILARFGELIGADRVYLDSIDLEAGRLRPVAGWDSERFVYPSCVPFDVPLDHLPRWIERLRQGGVAESGPPGSENPWTAELAAAFPSSPATAHLYAPLRVEGELLGVLGLGSIDLEHHWTQDEIETVQQVADTLANLFGRQRAADALAASEQRLSAMLSNIGDVLLVIDPEGWVRYVNDRVKDVLGHRPEDVLDGHFLTLVHPDDHEMAIDRFSQTVAGIEPPVTELRVMHLDGSLVWFDVDTSGTFDELLGGYVVSLRNVSVQRASIENADRHAELERVVLGLSQWALEVEPEDIIDGLHVHLERLGRTMHADIAFAALLEGDVVRNVAGWAADGAPHGYVFPVGESPMPAIVARYRTLEPLIISDIDLHHEDWADEWRSFPVADRAGLNVPLVSGGRCLGNVGVAMSSEVRVWTPEEISVVQRVSETVSAVLVRQRVEASLRTSESRLAALLEVAQTALDLDADHFFVQLPNVCDQVAQILDVDFVYVDQLDEHHRTVVNLAGTIRGEATVVMVPGSSVSFDDVPRWIERLRQPEQIVVEDAGTCDQPWAAEKRRSMGAEGGMMAVPMASGGELFGVVGVSMASSPRKWTDDEVTFLRVVAETISHVLERSRLDAALRSSEARFRLLSETAADVVILIDGAGVITYVSPSSTVLVGKRPDELVGSEWISIIHPDDREGLLKSAELLQHQGSFSSEMRLLRADGSAVWVVNSTSSVIDAGSGVAVEYRTSVRDITDRKRLEAELERQALHDPLTTLGNRILLQSHLEAATARRGSDNEIAVLLVDLDGFKDVNDTWGHAVGDEVLLVVAARLRALARPSDTVARTGGDEFVLLCPDTDRDSAVNIGHRIVEGLAAPMSTSAATVHLGASVGVAHHHGGQADADAMLIAADHAMYAAKRAGRGGVQVAADIAPIAAVSPVLR